MLNACRNHFPADLLCDAFIFHYEKMMRFGGEWHVVVKDMFPGYVFLETLRPEAFLSMIKQFEPMLAFLKNGQTILAVTEEEERFLKMFCGEVHLLKMSYGTIKDGQFFLDSGPLKGHEEAIVKADRHKRSAAVRIRVGQKEQMILAGLEIREKTVSEKNGRILLKQA